MQNFVKIGPFFVQNRKGAIKSSDIFAGKQEYFWKFGIGVRDFADKGSGILLKEGPKFLFPLAYGIKRGLNEIFKNGFGVKSAHYSVQNRKGAKKVLGYFCRKIGVFLEIWDRGFGILPIGGSGILLIEGPKFWFPLTYGINAWTK